MKWWLDRPRRVLLLVAVTSAVFVRLRSPFEPTVWEHGAAKADAQSTTEPTNLPVMEGALAPNNRLVGTEHLHEGTILAPEAFAIGDDGEVYTGLGDGRVIKLDKNGENPENVFFTGGFVSAAGRAVNSANGLDYGHGLLKMCSSKASDKALTLEDEQRCGRPLGVRWRQGKQLYILDAYHGLFVIEMKNGGRAKQLINSFADLPLALGESSANKEGGSKGVVAPEAKLPMTFLNDFIFTKDGTILLTDSSWKHPRAFNRREGPCSHCDRPAGLMAQIIDGASRGRLVRFDPSTGDLRTVMCGLHFPNGLQVDQSGTKLLMVESMRFRILSVDLEGLLSKEPRGGKAPASAFALADALGFCGESEALPDGVTIFAEALPGFVDGMHYDKEMGGYVLGCGSKVALPINLLHLALRKPGVIRTIVGKLIPIRVMDKLLPKYGLVVVVGDDGAVKDSMHDPTGQTAFVSAALRHPDSGYTFLGSSQNTYLGRVRL